MITRGLTRAGLHAGKSDSLNIAFFAYILVLLTSHQYMWFLCLKSFSLISSCCTSSKNYPPTFSQGWMCFCQTDLINTSDISVIKTKRNRKSGRVGRWCFLHLIGRETEVLRRLRSLQMVSQQVKGGAEYPDCGISVWSVPRQWHT